MMPTTWSPLGWHIRRAVGGGTPAPVIPDAANLRGYLEGDNLDGANNSTLVNGNPVGSVVNLGTLGGTFAQGTLANQPLFSTTAGPGGTKSALVFDGTDFLVSSLAASAWSFLHDGTGATIYSVVRTNASAIGTIVSTATGTAINRGVGHRYTTLFTTSYFMSDGAALQIVTSGAAASVVNGNFNLFTSTLSSADTPDANLYANGVMTGAGADAAAFSALAPANTLTIGATPVGGSGLVGPVRRIMIFQGSHSPATQAAVLAYMQGLDAVTYPAP